MKRARALEPAYLEFDDPLRQSGFSGGRERWVKERSPLIEAIERSGDFLDVGCANGLLAEDVVDWTAALGLEVIPHGVDLGPLLIDSARRRFPSFAPNFQIADAWTWDPPRNWTFVYAPLDLSPVELQCQWLSRLHRWVEPGGRLIIGSYGGRTPPSEPADVAAVMERCGLIVSGSTWDSVPPLTRFAWTESGK